MPKYIVKKCPALHSVLGNKNKCHKSMGGLASCSDIETCYMKKLIDKITAISKKKIQVYNDVQNIIQIPIREVVKDIIDFLDVEEVEE